MGEIQEGQRCQELGAVKRYWPGREPDIVCILHATDTKKIADALGIVIPLEMLSYRLGDELPDEEPKCSCSKGRVQEVRTG